MSVLANPGELVIRAVVSAVEKENTTLMRVSLALFLGLTTSRPAWSTVSVAGDVPTLAIKSATFRFYGPQDERVEGPAIFLNGPELCSGKLAQEVTGKIIYTDRQGSLCDMSIIYERLDRARALGLVLLGGFIIPGIETFRMAGGFIILGGFIIPGIAIRPASARERTLGNSGTRVL